jgi:hypothetical protein
MKWINGETWESIRERKSDWHQWFAWKPVNVSTVSIVGRTRHLKVWMENIERKGTLGCSGWHWVYRVQV